jgi:hypothetical protein
MEPTDRTADEVVRELRISKRSLERILSSDNKRPADRRAFTFHTWRLSKRIWSPAAYEKLKAAIERESEPGGLLSESKPKNATVIGMPSVRSALDSDRSAYAKVLAWKPPGLDAPKPNKQRKTSPTKSARARPDKSAVVIQLTSRR